MNYAIFLCIIGMPLMHSTSPHCECLHSYNLQCFYYSPSEELRDALLGYFGCPQATDLTCTGCNLKTLTRISIKTEIKYLILAQSNILTLDRTSLAGTFYQRLKTLNLDDNALTELPPGVFGELLELEILKLSGNKIKTLSKGVFDGYARKDGKLALKHLHTLYLDGNLISRIEPNVFNNSNNLLNLYLNGNNLQQSLTTETFMGLASIRNLYLQNCAISFLPPGVFYHLTKLNYIDLNGNNFAHYQERYIGIQPGAFENLHSLKTLNLSNCNIRTLQTNTFKGLNNLQTLNFSDNRLAELQADNFDFEKLEILDLRYNNIAELDLKAEIGELKTLFLSYNRLTKIADGAFEKQKHLENLYLNNNKLKTVDEHTFEGSKKLKELHLEKNSFKKPITTETFNKVESLETLYLQGNRTELLKNAGFQFINELVKILNLPPKLLNC